MAMYKVLSGQHREKGVTYKKGDIIETEKDLLKHNRAGVRKYERVEGRRRTTAPTPLTPEELKAAQTLTNTGPAVPPAIRPPLEEGTLREDDDFNEGEAAEDRQAMQDMTVQELHEVAEQDEIDLGGAKRKEDIIKAILKHRHSKAK